MTCDETRKLLSQLVDDELDPLRRSAVQEHLRGCPECRVELQSMSDLRTSLSGALAPPDVTQDEWDGLAARAVSTTSRRFGAVLFWPAVMALAIGGLVSFFSDESISLWVRVSLGVSVAGISFMALSAISERFSARRRERYEGVER